MEETLLSRPLRYIPPLSIINSKPDRQFLTSTNSPDATEASCKLRMKLHYPDDEDILSKRYRFVK